MVYDSSFILVGAIFDRPPVKQQGYRGIKRLSVILSGVEVCGGESGDGVYQKNGSWYAL
jgi:hypothetical protein